MTLGAHGPVGRRPCRLPTRSSHTLEYAAFRQTHQHTYLRYACARTGDPVRAAKSVEEAFLDLSAQWETVLRGACPASVAWGLLTNAVTRAAWEATAEPLCAVHCVLSRAQADTVLLCHHLGLTEHQAAYAMGQDTFIVRGLLLSADRVLKVLPPGVKSLLGAESSRS
ncbi:hypothetical protein [Streptomyces candidus]|uniref:Uncharacterized protein n=1 Tax=Streptomyces candidus TaxID=67283 RepID=A0A7X0HPT4_9ACTN|nr:hypothetical protein [Streptomyces candidus]MBB6440153.1 hypothetical protein [Streptomyces candidus]GHH57627.1 hypothetical protein GCM10018773_65210 [Streptomyces candidus]